MPLDPSALEDIVEIRTRLDSIESKVRAAIDEEPPPPPSDEWSDQTTWPDRIAWIVRQVGPKTALTPVTSANPPAGCRVVGSTLYVDTATLLENISFAGTITPTDASAGSITLRNVAAQDLFAASNFWRVSLVEDSAFTIPSYRVASGWGQGCLNALKPGFVVRRTLMQGGADGAQVSGPGAFEECVIRNLTIGTTTHNDFIQHYGPGLVTVDRTYMSQSNVAPNHLNGLFCDGGKYDVSDCAIVVTAPTGTNAYALHAGKYATASQIVIDNSYVRGRQVEKISDAIVMGSGVDYAAGY